MQFGLVGNPLGHSLSKEIHTELFNIKCADNSYELYSTCDLDETFDRTLSHLDGFNITIPYKTDIIKHLDCVDEKVKLYNSCNTVVKRDGRFYGYNTDVNGFLRTLKVNGICLMGKKILVLGSGGVSRMMVFESVLQGAEVYITSRNIKKCMEIADETKKKLHKEITVLDDIGKESGFDIVANGTPCGMFPNELSLPVKFSKIMNVLFVFDTIYNPKETLLTRLAHFCNNNAANGLGMLVSQAAEAQTHFCGLEYTEDEVQCVIDKMKIENFSLNKNIIMIGMPGCGKSSVGKLIAGILNLDFCDIDECIEKEYGNITEIFDKKGEPYFRKIESDMLKRYADGKNRLISTGGGIVENSEIMQSLKDDENNIILFVDVAFDLLLNRVSRSDKRPLLRGNAYEKLKLLYERRYDLYVKYANCRVSVLREQSMRCTAVNCVESLCGFE